MTDSPLLTPDAPAVPDRRLSTPYWRPGGIDWRGAGGRLLLLANLALAAWYLTWLLRPGRADHPLLYGMLVGAEAFNLVQGLGFWWTYAVTFPNTHSGTQVWSRAITPSWRPVLAYRKAGGDGVPRYSSDPVSGGGKEKDSAHVPPWPWIPVGFGLKHLPLPLARKLMG